MTQALAPIVLFVFNRPSHTQQTLEALSKNTLAADSRLYIYADGPKENASEEDLRAVRNTREVLRSKRWCREVIIMESEVNKGLASSIVHGVSEILNRHDKVIVLEDDLVTSVGFLKYMNEALTVYQHDDRVMHVSGYMYPVTETLEKHTVFLRILSCWGWGTWKRAWSHFMDDTGLHLKRLNSKRKVRRFNILGSAPFYDQLVQNNLGKINTWAVKWYGSWYFQDGISLFPETTLVVNIGHDGSGIHCATDTSYLPNFIADEIIVVRQEIVENRKYLKLIDYFYRSIMKRQAPTGLRLLIYRLKRFLLKIVQSVCCLVVLENLTA